MPSSNGESTYAAEAWQGPSGHRSVWITGDADASMLIARQVLLAYALLWVNGGKGTYLTLVLYPTFVFFLEGELLLLECCLDLF
jgi:hypothetical protein